MKIKIVKLPGAVVPEYKTSGAAGADLYANEEAKIYPGTWTMVSTGISIQLPQDTVGMVCSRSGLAFKRGVAVLNAPGIIDSDYTGEVCVILVNHGDRVFHVEKGDRIAQLVFMPTGRMQFEETDSLTETDRGGGGFGSTGMAA